MESFYRYGGMPLALSAEHIAVSPPGAVSSTPVTVPPIDIEKAMRRNPMSGPRSAGRSWAQVAGEETAHAPAGGRTLPKPRDALGAVDGG
jgi:hypothetical protein